jgi:hypothetical protein
LADFLATHHEAHEQVSLNPSSSFPSNNQVKFHSKLHNFHEKVSSYSQLATRVCAIKIIINFSLTSKETFRREKRLAGEVSDFTEQQEANTNPANYEREL